MPIVTPGFRYGKRLRKSHIFGGHGPGKKGTFADLLITPLVDMFVIIVLFLIANFSATGEVLSMTKEVQLPEASNVKEVEMVPVVMVTKQQGGDVNSGQVILSGTVIGRVDELSKEDYLNIPALEEKLREMKKQYEDLRALANDQDGFKGDVNIQADKDVQFKIVKRVMFSCATAGYNNINFATLQIAVPEAPKAAAPAAP
ncbi:MAG: biopolymer transporter ExbD [Deltaproteobacteria bacterium]|nr:biopolymer transporter ExbD [Deltaproteobacteria bacterium]